MARQEAQSKLLYYPTPLSLVELIATWLSAGQGLTRLADPCIGQGEALHTLSDRIFHGGNSTGGKVETWGIELSYARAEIAATVIDTVLPTSFYQVGWASRSVSLVFDNPPYDWSDTVDEKGHRLRHEVMFATKTTAKLVEGGIHVLIVPQRILADETLSRHWAGWYDDSLLFRFPNAEFEVFGQVVLIGRARDKYLPPTKAQIESFQAYGQLDVELSPLVGGDGRYVLPAAPTTARFSYTPFDDETMVRAAAPTNLLGTPEWGRATYVRPIGAPINPLVQLKIGHLSMLISAGELGVVSLDLPEGRSLVKGTLTKTITRSEEPVLNQDGEVSGIRVEEREHMASVISLLHADGQRERLSGTQEVADFITRHAAPLADAVLDRNRPFYDWKPARCDWDKAAKTALGLPPLPGRSERGLFDVQKHFAIAAALRMRTGQHVVLNCEMGFGKTATAVGALEQRDRWPALVMCPGHMVEKWRRDLEGASNPAVPIHARIITRPARAEATWFHEKVAPLLNEYGAQIVSDDRFQVPSTGENDTGLRRRLTLSLGLEQRRYLLDRLTKLLTVKGRGENATVRPTLRQELDGLTVEFMDRDDYTLADFFANFDQGRLGRKAVAVIAFEPAKYDAGLATINLPRRWLRLWDEREGLTILAKVPCCPGCGHPLGVKEDGGKLVAQASLIPLGQNFELRPSIPATCPHVKNVPVLDEAGHPILQNCNPLMALQVCNSPLYEMSRWRRVGLSRLIQRQYNHKFQVYIADEVHESKGSDTDIGTADGRFLSSIRDSLALTGTLFGGTASSLFYLLYRRSPEVRQLYGYKDASRWVDHFGLWKYRWTEKANGTDRGASSAVTRWDVRPPQELPGVSPAVIRFLLPITLFGKITDLGYTLPGLADKVQAVDMGEALGSQYREASSVLLQKALDRLRTDNDAGMLTTWFTTIRYRPMSAFRDEVVSFKGEPIMNLPAVTFDEREHLPKEERLAELVRTNVRLGRKTLVFVEQTGTRDIRDRLQSVLRQRVPGANVQTLSANDMRPSKRELWIKRNAPLMDCLLVNAGLVKTGLDLVMFSDIVFYETNTSLYTVWQAMRRVWRLGQKNPVTTTFLAYDAAVEAALLDLMGEKMKAAMLLYGDNAAGALVDSDGEDDLAREMIRRALGGKTIETAGAVNGQSLFGGETVVAIPVSDSPMGSPIATSPVLPVMAPEPAQLLPAHLQQLDLFGGLVSVTARKRR
jgi:Uncharacterised methyltransferase family (DUF6094)